jgi:hypothetical protein
LSLADACLVRMTETLADPVIVTTDQDFRAYRRHSRQVVPWYGGMEKRLAESSIKVTFPITEKRDDRSIFGPGGVEVGRTSPTQTRSAPFFVLRMVT